ncbi:MAG: GNAT family N-acetyltransferase [Campylobacterota bacterium]|nr:GNAT family N-acetyltransferase [Campylobacterota bacterium]
MKEVYREYQKTDYQQCEALVNQAWSFDETFKPKALSKLANLLYTEGSEVGSNYKRVVEAEGKVVGFIFGFNTNYKKPKKDIFFSLLILFKLLFVKSTSPDKKSLLDAISTHEKNRSQIVNNDKSEIVLFVVDEKYQGKGYGKNLWMGFREFCHNSNVTSVVVETNSFGASAFYEKIGFHHLKDFDSPLHEFVTKGGQACIYEFRCD